MLAVKVTNLYGLKSFSIGGSLVKNVCVQIEIGKWVTDLYRERSFSIAAAARADQRGQ